MMKHHLRCDVAALVIIRKSIEDWVAGMHIFADGWTGGRRPAALCQ
jgi:hypothetical protein